MPLNHFLYRCPRCGADPLAGEGDRAWCGACGCRFERGEEGGLIEVRDADGNRWQVPGRLLGAAVAVWGGAGTRAFGAGDRLFYEGEVEMRKASAERPVWHRGELLGFAEALGPPVSGHLRLTDDSLRFRAGGEGGRGAGEEQWPLLEIRAVQTSSRALQVVPGGNRGVLHFEFPQDSPRRWEELLHLALRRVYRKAGLGEIVEFQPRIVTVAP